MSSRYVFTVVYKGRERVRQYGHGNGTPITIIPDIIRFANIPDNLGHLKQNLQKCKFAHHNHQLISEKLFCEIHNSRPLYTYWKTPDEKMNGFHKAGGFSKKDIFKYILCDRTVGYCILDVLVRREADKAKSIYLRKARTTEVSRHGYDASYVINLDNGYVYCQWKKRKMKFSLSNPPSWEEIKLFEWDDEEEE